MKIGAVLFIVILIFAIVLPGCTGQNPTSATSQNQISSTTQTSTAAASTTSAAAKPSSTQSQASAVKMGGTLKVIMAKPAVAFGYPPRIQSSDANYAIPVFERLLSVGDGNVYLPELALKWQTASDGKSITFNLRQGVKFHDGTDFNAKAVKWNYDLLIPPKSTILSGVSSIDVIDDYTVRISLSKPSNLVLFNLASSSFCYIASPAAIEKNSPDWADTNPVGTGPFMLKSFERNVAVNYIKNPNYWEKGQPYLDGMQFTAIADGMTAMMALKSGQANEYYDALFTFGAQLRDQGYSMVMAPAGLYALNFDISAGSVFANPKVRQAIEYAINKESICNDAGLGFYKPLYQFALDTSPDYNKDLIPRKYDPAKAKQLLTEAGLDSGFSFKASFPSTQWKDGITVIQSNLAQVGIKMEILYVTSAVNNLIKLEGKIGKGEAAWMNTQSYPNNLFTIDQYLRSDSPYYSYMIKPAGTDALIDQAKLTSDNASQSKIIQQIAKLVYDDETFVPLWMPSRIVVLDKTVQDHGWFINGDSNNAKFNRTWLK